VERLDPAAVVALRTLTRRANEKAVKLVLRGVNVNAYKVLKLVALAQHFTFVS
jgi:anti-anti-sigma regulatory factor